VGNVVDFAARAAELRAAKQPAQPANDPEDSIEVSLTEEDEADRLTPEGSALYECLTKNGITVLNEETLRDFRTVMKLVRGMKDRQAGNSDSQECVMLECVAQGLGYHKDVPQDDSFDDLLSKLD
jgi:hypothetical protein